MSTMNTGPASRTSPTDEVEAAQAALEGEHACVYGYGVVGAYLPDDADAAAEALAAHRDRRDALAALVRDAGAEPVASAGTYALPVPIDGATQATALAAQLETRLAALYADLVAAATSAPLREFGARALVATTVEHGRWNGAAVAFPGLAGRPGTPGTPAPAPQSTSTRGPT